MLNLSLDKQLTEISILLDKGERISAQQAIVLYDKAPLFWLMDKALNIKKRISSDKVFYNHNFHIEPTNICKFNCKFCSYRKREGEFEAWDMSMDEISKYIDKYYNNEVTEVHLVGGVNPNHDFNHYKNIISLVRSKLPQNVSIKAYSAVEHIEMIKKAGLSFEQGIQELIEVGMDSVTGGGAEIFDEALRSEICPDKASSKEWLDFHQAAHIAGVKTNSTMLYGHIETPAQRIDHLIRLRDLQDKTQGFLSFIPLKYRCKNNPMGACGECSIVEDLRTLAISRIVLDNFPHIKAYWPMYGKNTTQLALLCGADDVDGTLQDTTKIYSMAGVDENSLSQSELVSMINEIGFVAVERDTFYNEVKR